MFTCLFVVFTCLFVELIETALITGYVLGRLALPVADC